jgi:hypothetical protein
MAALPAAAMGVADLYTVRIPVDDTSSGWRADAYERGLADVLVRVTGQREAANDPALLALFEDPGRLVQGFRREADALWVSFDGRAIAGRLQEAGRAVWGSDRPLSVIWLAVDRGSGERDLVAAPDEAPPPPSARRTSDQESGEDAGEVLRERVEDVATLRGIPVVWPLMDAEDRGRVAFSDVWGGFEEPVLAASERYAANSVLLGRVDAGGRQLPRWTWYFGGEQRQWRGPVDDAIHRVADMMAGQLAAAGEIGTTSVRLVVSGVDDLKSYADVSRYLESSSVIRELELEEVGGGALTYRLEVLGATDRLARVLELSGRFGSVEGPDEGVGPAGTPGFTAEYLR